MRLFVGFIGFLLLDVFFSPCSFSQSLEELGVIQSRRFLVLTIVGDGGHKLGFANTFAIRDPAALSRLVTSDLVKNEIGLNDQQLRECEKLLADSRAFVRESRERIISASDNGLRNEFAGWFTNEAAEIEAELRAALGEEGLEKVKRVERQMALRKNGVFHELEFLFEANGIRLSDADFKNLDSVKSKYRNKLKLVSETLLASLIDNEFADLKSLVKGDSGEVFRLSFPINNPTLCLDLISIQAQGAEGGMPTALDEAFDAFFKRPKLYSIGDSGNWEVIGFDSFSRAGNFEMADCLSSFVNSLVAGSLGDGLEMTDSQRLSVMNVRQTIEQKFNEMELYLASSENIWLDYENVMDMQIGLSRSVESELNKIFDSGQIRKLQKELSRLSAVKNGLSISDADLKEQFGLSQAQVNILRDSVSSASKKIKESSGEFFLEYATDAFSAIEGDEARILLKSYYGKLKSVGDASLLVMQLDLSESE